MGCRADGSTITTDRPVLLDVGAAGKGRLVDIVVQTLIGADVPDFVVGAGGDLCHHGDRPPSVGPEHPLDPSAWSVSSSGVAMRWPPRPSTAALGWTG